MINKDVRSQIKSAFSIQSKALLSEVILLKRCSVLIESFESDKVMLDFGDGVKFELSFKLVNVSDVL